MRPNTSASGIFSTKRSSPVSTSMLTRMLVPKPKKAFQSPGVHNAGLKSDFRQSPSWSCSSRCLPLLHCWKSPVPSPSRTAAESLTQPKMPPWALIIFRPISWNSGKYEAQQSASTTQR